MSEPAAIPRRPLHAELVERVRTMIVEGEIPAGERISEKELCARFAVSRTPLREALKVLALEGYVILTPNRGASAAALTRADLEEAFPVMGALEALAGELACRHASEEEVRAILALHREMAAHHTRGERQPYFRLNERIHLAIAEAARNPTLERMQRSLDGRVRRGRYQANISQARWDQAMAEHERIADALSARDGARLAEELRQHLLNKMHALSDKLDESG
ncbi:MAG: GntR family transcriptional regulator [Pseudomonadota bacterium]